MQRCERHKKRDGHGRRWRSAGAIAAAACWAAYSQPAFAVGLTLHVANRPDFIDSETVQKFEAESGITVTYDTDKEDEAVLDELKANNPRGWDLVLLPSRLLQTAIAGHLLQPIDKQKLSNLGNLSPQTLFDLQQQDQGNRFSIPYLWGSAGLVANSAQYSATVPAIKLNSLSALFDPVLAAKAAPCGIAVEDSPGDVVPAVFLSLGLDPWSENPRDLKAVQDRLTQLKPILRRLSPDEFSDALASGKICLGFGASVDVAEGQSRADDRDTGVSLSYVIPRERSIRWIDVLAMPSQSVHKAEALAFIDYLLRPEVIATISDWTGAANPNRLAADFMAADAGDQTAFPDDNARQRLIPDATLSTENAAIRIKIWEKTKP